MRPTRHAAVLATLCATLFLPACAFVEDAIGVGSSGSRSGSVSEPVPDSLADAQTADPEAARVAGARAANTLPKFASVTQSSNSASGVTTDTASATLDGRRLTLRVERADGSSLTLDSAAGPSESQDIELPVEGRSGRAYALLDFGELSLSRTAISVAAVYTSWNDDDPMNYLAGGYWLHVAGDLFDPEDIEVEIGSFMDGPELSGTAALPSLGTASYRGPATGIYAYEYGGGHADRAQGSAAVGEFFGAATLDADFATETISGSIGIMGVYAVGATPDGEEFELHDEDTGLRLDLGSTSFGANGSFAGTDVTVASTDPDREIARSGGTWGGRFSNILEAGEPRLAGGTVGAEWEERDGGQGVLLGAFFGARHEPAMTTAE